MKIKIETLDEIFSEIETEERFEIILPFLKKIAELEEKNEALEEKIENENERLNNQIIDLQRENKQLREDIFRRNEND